MAELKKGHNFAIQDPTEKKKICDRLFFFCTDATYKNFKFLAQAVL